jgi:hypothetical protein
MTSLQRYDCRDLFFSTSTLSMAITTNTKTSILDLILQRITILLVKTEGKAKSAQVPLDPPPQRL